MRKLLVSLILVAMPPTPTLAQDTATGGGKVEVLGTTFSARSIGHDLDGCKYTYLVSYPDYIDKNGAVVILGGYVLVHGLRKAAKQPIVMLTVSGFDTAGSAPLPFQINYAYLSGGGVSYAGKEFARASCGEDGSSCTGYTLLDKPAIGLIISEGFEINYNRGAGHTDVSVPVRPGLKNSVAAIEFSQCVREGLGALQRQAVHRGADMRQGVAPVHRQWGQF